MQCVYPTPSKVSAWRYFLLRQNNSVYTQGPLGYLLGFWLSGPKRCGAINREQVWSEFGHPILRRSFSRVLRLYADTSPFLIFLVLHVAFECILWPFCNSALFISPYMYAHCYVNLVFVLLKYSTLSKIQDPYISSIIGTVFFLILFIIMFLLPCVSQNI